MRETLTQAGNHHTLGEILVEQDLSMEERAKRAARRAPFWVIALMVHVIIAGVMGMMYFHQAKKTEVEAVVSISEAAPEAPKIDETPPPADHDFELKAIPDVPAADLLPTEESFEQTYEGTVNPYATESGTFGMSEAEIDGPSDLLTMSSGGFGLSTAIGVGAGGHRGGGMKRGSPYAGPRLARRNEQPGLRRGELKAVDGALEWLARHQSPDGSWDPNGYVAQCDSKHGARCEGRGMSTHIAGVTGLALLAFLGCGFDSQTGPPANPYRENVIAGLKWLRNNQDAEGCFGPRSDQRFTYDHACATIAMCENYAMTKQAAWKKSAQSALDFVAACQNPYGAWRYGKQPGDNDVSVTGWMIMALKAGKEAGLSASERAMKEGVAYIDSITDPETGRTGYTKPGEHCVRPEGGAAAQWPATESEALTAVALCSRIFAGTADEKLSLMKAGQELLEKRLPVWDEQKGSIDMYYWYYGTLAMHQMGGVAWDRWNQKLKTEIVDRQVKAGCTNGSWEPKDPWCDDGGRVYSTALMALCLEVYYRFPKVFGTKK
jgi:hypothetical protein